MNFDDDDDAYDQIFTEGSKETIQIKFSPEKVIKLSNGRCYLIDELAGWIHSTKKNITLLVVIKLIRCGVIVKSYCISEIIPL